MKKTIMFLSACLVLSLGLTSCGCQDDAAVDTAPPSATPSSGAEYNANGNGTVDGDSNPATGNNGIMDGNLTDNGMTGNDTGTSTPNGTIHDNDTGNAGNATNTTDPDTNATGDGVLGDVGRAVDDVAHDTERAVRDIF